MSDDPGSSRDITVLAILFEGGLALVALAVGWSVGHEPLATISLTAETLPSHGVAALWGVAATLPMLAGLAVIDRLDMRPFVRLRRALKEIVVPVFSGATILQLALISLAAGIGEEMFFRGLVQDGLAATIAEPTGMWIGLAVASLVFGLLHCITVTYAVLATLVGVYLGGLFILTGDLTAPIVAHGLYDFLALIYLVRKWPAEKQQPAP